MGKDAWEINASPQGAVMLITHGNGFDVHDNRQPFQPSRNMVLALATNSCKVTAVNNVIPGAVGQKRVVGTC